MMMELPHVEKYGNNEQFKNLRQNAKVEMVLKNNNLTFDGNHCLQINGTAMGTKMASSYANIFIGDLEE